MALGCFKVVAWFDKDGALRATGFRLSQAHLVEGIEFEALNFDKLFKLEQVPLAWIESATGLGFAAALKNANTFSEGNQKADSAALERLVSGGQVRVPSAPFEETRPLTPEQ